MRIVILTLLICLISSCGNEDAPEANKDLTGKSEMVLQYAFSSGMDISVDTTAKMIIRIEGQKFSGKGPVNNFFGQLNNGMTSGPIGSTMMAGPENMMQMETRFMELLEGGKFTGIGEDTLKVIKEDKVVLIYTKVSR